MFLLNLEQKLKEDKHKANEEILRIKGNQNRVDRERCGFNSVVAELGLSLSKENFTVIQFAINM